MPDPAERLWVQSMAEAYERLLVPTVFAPFAGHLATAVLATEPSRVLELAAGTGVLTRALLAADERVEVTATDLNAAMVELGATRVPGARWHVADAMDLPFPDASFDAVTCQFGAMFFPDRVTAFSEARRVLVPGGVLVLSTWDALAAHAFESVVVDVLRQAFPDDPPTFLEDVPHGCADPLPLLEELRRAGLVDTASERVVVTGQAATSAGLARGYCTGTPLRAALIARGAEPETVAEQVAAGLAERLGPDPVSGSMAAHVLRAAAPPEGTPAGTH